MPPTVGIMLGVGAIALVLIALGQRSRSRDLGAVSHTWVIENRSDRHNDQN